MNKANLENLPSVLSFITVTAKDTGLDTFEQMSDVITDGSFAIRRDCLKGMVKLPSFLLQALNKQVDSGTGVKIDSLVHDPKNLIAIEPINAIKAAHTTFKSKPVPVIEFKKVEPVEGDIPIEVNARYLKLVWEIFPGLNWYANFTTDRDGVSRASILVLKDDSGTVAVLAPIWTK